jgi:GTP-dependent phosphoenolpyruvate carboxykinase
MIVFGMKLTKRGVSVYNALRWTSGVVLGVVIFGAVIIRWA